MNAIATISQDIQAVGAAAMAAVSAGDWEGLERYEAVRLQLVGELGAIARQEALRDAALAALYQAADDGLKIARAVEAAQLRHNASSGAALRQDRAVRAYAATGRA
jgi:hypothetical protein